MAIGIVSNEEFESELASLTSPTNQSIEIKEIERGRGNGNNAVPDGLRRIISEEAINGTSIDEIKRAFEVSSSSISAYKNGATSTASYNNPKPDLISHNNDIRLRISSRAKSKVMAAMKHITDDRLQVTKIRDLASIAKDMSIVSKNMEPDTSNNGQTNQNNFIFYAPRQKQSDDYDVIELK
jgi:hypothetical protein